MSRSKKSRSLKSKVSLKTGSKSKILDEDGNRGNIPSKNKLSKHKKKPKSAYAKAMSAKGKSNEPEAIKVVPHPFKEALKQRALEEEQAQDPQELVATKRVLTTKKTTKKVKPKAKVEAEPVKAQEAPIEEDEIDDSKNFKDLDGDELLDFFEKF